MVMSNQFFSFVWKKDQQQQQQQCQSGRAFGAGLLSCWEKSIDKMIMA
jgi:hypothetical protein